MRDPHEVDGATGIGVWVEFVGDKLNDHLGSSVKLNAGLELHGVLEGDVLHFVDQSKPIL